MPFSSIKPRVALAVSCTAHIAQDGLSAAIYVLMPVLAQAFGFTYAQVGLIKGLKNLSQGVLEIYSGVLSERISEARTLVVGLTLSGIAYALLSLAPTPTLVVACLLIVGAGTAFQHSPASSLVNLAYADRGRRAALGVYNSSGDFGKLAFTGLFGLAIGVGIAWQQVALLFGLSALLAAAAIAFTVWHWNTGSPIAVDQSTGNDIGDDPGWGILNWRSFGTLLVIIALDNMVQAGLLVFVAFLMIAKGLPIAIATLATVALLIGGIFGKAGCGYLADRIGVRPAFALVQMLTALGLVVVVAAPAWLAFILLPPLGVVTQGSTTITYGLVPDLIHPRRVARGYAVMYASTSIAAAVGPWLFGLFGDRFGISGAVLGMALVAVLSVPPLAILPAFQEAKRLTGHERN